MAQWVSPNFDDRPDGVSPDMLVLHYTGMESAQAALERLCDPAFEVSAHYLVDEDGQLYALVDEDKRAWHAGISRWGDRVGINQYSIGIEIVNPGHEFGYQDFTDKQMKRVLDLVHDIRRRHVIPDTGIVGHSDIAPDRKDDPGEKFPWQWLAANGVGIALSEGELPPETEHATEPYVTEASDAAQITAVQKQFTAIGYPLDPDGLYSPYMRSIVTAFQRRWRQSVVNGNIDYGTYEVLVKIAQYYTNHQQ
ncbi:N-acetylmuramoyl-L-alanine amidase [Kordiimonas sediminis]|uniref:N-acetylmuramoyl-L-alanine amidase n=1 Tax=Kordiimonas sediminis TaxID=1735581 RepID=A0A919E7T7_9PROT|nr:N-acetylmuramoyl-L-alanine amidase [Kordiimonas sediminis]GHF23009.1 N-acetylmuramoyl-L-alanine amidase [Kordiimonas sediminis]